MFLYLPGWDADDLLQSDDDTPKMKAQKSKSPGRVSCFHQIKVVHFMSKLLAFV